MNINFKYYIVTIASIFLAIGIGIVIGFNVNNNEELAKQQEALVKDLDKGFEDLTNKNKDLNEKIKIKDRDLNQYEKYIVANKGSLKNKIYTSFIGIISTDIQSDNAQEVKKAIQEGGGYIAYDITIDKSIFTDEAKKLIGDKVNSTINSQNDLSLALINILTAQDQEQSLRELESKGYLKINELNSNYNTFNSVVLQGTLADDQQDKNYMEFATNMGKNMKAKSMNTVYVRNSKDSDNMEKQYTSIKVNTIDNIDKEIGKMIFIMLMSDKNIIGNFGRGGDSTVAIPAINIGNE